MSPEGRDNAVLAVGLSKVLSRRASREPDVGLQEQFDGISKRFKDQRRAAGGVLEGWMEALAAAGVSEQVIQRTTVVGVSRGVLTLRAADAATKYALDRVFRSGGEAAVARAAGVGLRRVKVAM